jgi:hypothetical protein
VVIQVYKVSFSGNAVWGAEDPIALYELLVRHFPPKAFVSGFTAEPITNVTSIMHLFSFAQLIFGSAAIAWNGEE